MMLHGIDVSSWQGAIRWDLVHQDFVFVRANDGHTQDARFQENWTGCKRFPRGTYSFLRCGDGAGQADALIHALRRFGYEPSDFSPVIDVEEDALKGATPEAVLASATAFSNRIASDLGRQCHVYTNPNTLTLLGACAPKLLALGGFHWIAQYRDSPPSIPWQVWQYGVRDDIAGVSGMVDCNWAKPEVLPCL
jgi:GH25 family lysozyme M1 (1,4-beta-N-acetylmuramidase)